MILVDYIVILSKFKDFLYKMGNHEIYSNINHATFPYLLLLINSLAHSEKKKVKIPKS